MLKVDSRRINIYVAIVLSIGVLAIIGFSLFLKPAIVDLDNAAGDGREQPSKPAAPAPKKPPLN
jgi:hypothetical protein